MVLKISCLQDFVFKEAEIIKGWLPNKITLFVTFQLLYYNYTTWWNHWKAISGVTCLITSLYPFNWNKLPPVHFPISEHPKINFKERESQLWGKMNLGRLDIYLGGEEMDWGDWETVRWFNKGVNGLGKVIQKW